MKKQVFTALIIGIVLTSALFINLGNADSQGTTTIQSSGTISQSTNNKPSSSDPPITIIPDISIRANGKFYEAVLNSELIYGGSGNVGGINGSSFSDVVNAASNSLSGQQRFYDSFEQDFSKNWASVSGNITRDSSTGVKFGNYSARAVIMGSSDSAYVTAPLNNQLSTADLRFFVKTDFLPGLWSNEVFLKVQGPKGDIVYVGYERTSSGMAIKLTRFFPSYLEEFSGALNIDTASINAIELRFTNDAVSGSFQVYFNGSLVLSDTGLNTATSGGATLFVLGLCHVDTSGTATAWFDDVVAGTSYVGLSQGSGATGGGSIEIQSGNYVSDKSAFIGNNIVVFGHDDATFIQQKANIAPYQSVFVIASSIKNVTIKNLAIDGNKANQVINGDTMNQGILVSGEDVLIDTVHITNMLQCGVDVPYAFNVTIENSMFSGSGDGDIWIDISTNDYVVRNNIISNGNIGIALVFFDNAGNHTGLVTNNSISGMTSYGIECWKGMTTQPYGVTVSYNKIINSRQSGIMIQGFSNSTFEYNIVTTSRLDAITLSGSNNIAIRNNNLNSNGNYGIKESTSDYNTISSNDLRYNQWGPIGYSTATDGAHDALINNSV